MLTSNRLSPKSSDVVDGNSVVAKIGVWPWRLLPLLHFVIVGIAALGIHYANGIDIGGYTGDYGLWMDVGNVGIRAFEITRFGVPIAILTAAVFHARKGGAIIWMIAGSLIVWFATWPVYSGLISFWERSWTNQ